MGWFFAKEDAVGTGDVVGPSSGTDNAIVRFDGVTGKLIQDSVGILSDTGVLTGVSLDWSLVDKTVSDIADITTKSHTSLTDIGTNDHATIDSHIGDASIHFVDPGFLTSESDPASIHLNGDNSPSATIDWGNQHLVDVRKLGLGVASVGTHDFIRVENGVAETEHMRMYMKSNTSGKIPGLNGDMVDQPGQGAGLMTFVGRHNGTVVGRMDFCTAINSAVPVGKDSGSVIFSVKDTGQALGAGVVSIVETGELQLGYAFTPAYYDTSLIWGSDGGGDIGKVASNRPSDVYVKDSINLDALTASQVLVSDASKNIVSSGVSSANLTTLTDGSNADALHSHTLSSPGGADTQIQFNNSGSFDGDANLVWDDSNTRLGIGTASPATRVEVRDNSANPEVAIINNASYTNYLILDANNGSSNQNLGIVEGRWNGTPVGQISFRSGDDNTGKDDGYLLFSVAEGGSLTNAFRLEQERTAIFYGQAYSIQDTETQAASAAHTIDWNEGNSTVWDLQAATGDVTLTMSNPHAGASYVIVVIQGSTARNITWPANVKWPGGTAPVISTSDDAKDIIALYYDGTDYLATFNQNFLAGT